MQEAIHPVVISTSRLQAGHSRNISLHMHGAAFLQMFLYFQMHTEDSYLKHVFAH